MSIIVSIGAIVALVFLALGIAALPALRKATREGRKLVSAHSKLAQDSAIKILDLDERVRSLERHHAEEMSFDPARKVALLDAIDAAVSMGHLRQDEGHELRRRVNAKLSDMTCRHCVDVKPEGSA